MQRASIAADATAPIFGKARSFTLPADFLRIAPRYPEDLTNDLDWEIEGDKIYTDDTAPLQIRYVARITDTTKMDALFIEALAADLAYELCEEITQSNTKIKERGKDKKEKILEARHANAIESLPAVPPATIWTSERA
jgi:hypothetical protein